MKKLPLVPSALALALALSPLLVTGCASTSAAGPQAPAFEGPPARVVELPTTAGEGEPRELKIVVDIPALKLATVTLRQGTILPDHSASIPVTIMALSGSGVVTVGTERLQLDPGHAVVLGPDVVHAVVPDPGTDMVVLVHHLGQGEHKHAH
ncbi:MAG: hypothetical protein CVU56_16125 [Deltaproteobacteria bacterium HGW-Deltaproteobacteria-14]|jgi:quercetin dioxygenase-like cupin family protein|nr:MAG: hypothetical protein CVU56_16125 [Deltaproteobacteria bacterium HGW-Deltaproteobacteria-14]